MIKNIAVQLLTAAVIFIVSGCGISNMDYNNQYLSLQTDKRSVERKGILLAVQKESYGTLYLVQKILRLDEGNIVVYEDAITDSLYEFEPGITRSIKVIFNARSVIIVYRKNHLYAYQLILQNGKILNIIAQQDEPQHLRMVYGMNSLQLDSMVKALEPDIKRAYYRQVITIKDTNKAVFSKWSVQKVHFYPLVSPVPKMLPR